MNEQNPNYENKNIDRVITQATSDKFIILFKKYIGIQMAMTAFFIIVIGVLLLWLSHEKAQTIFSYFVMKEVGKALFVTALISVPVKWFMTRQMDKLAEEKNTALLKNICKDNSTYWASFENKIENQYSKVSDRIKKHDECVQSEINKISACSSSLIALHDSCISKVYGSRSEAGNDMIAELKVKNLKTVQIIGISLNDFTRDENPDFHSIWKSLQDFISGKEKAQSHNQLKIQILVIDPDSEGAYLRSKAEERGGEPSRLVSDVKCSMEKLFKKMEHVVPEVQFAVKLYRLSPIMFMFRTNFVSFVQQYYFRPIHESGLKIPIAKYTKSDEPDRSSVHDELEEHFNWIWNNASITIEDYYVKHIRGPFNAIKDASITNIYYKNQEDRRKRIEYLVSESKNILWIKGISLKSFFQLDSDLYYALRKTCKKKDIDVRILLIDPSCEQARIRSFREYLLTHENCSLADFKVGKLEKQRLHRETNDSIDSIRNDLLPSLPPDCSSSLKVGLYSSAPEAFLLLTDEAVLVEQYHYGLIISGAAHRRILGGNVPLTEYKKEDANIYQIYKDHFEYVYTYWTKLIETSSPERQQQAYYFEPESRSEQVLTA